MDMRLVTWTLLLMLVLPGTGGYPSQASGSEVAEDVWRTLQSARWGQAVGPWEQTYRDASCEPFRGSNRETSTDDEWSYRCTQHGPTSDATWWFYAYNPTGPVARLERLRVDAIAASEEDLRQAHSLLAQRLTQRYGGAITPTKDEVSEFGSAYWRDVLLWRPSGLEVYIFLDTFPQRPHLSILVKGRGLLEAIAEDERVYGGRLRQWPDPWKTVDADLSRELQGDYPEVAGLLTREGATPPTLSIEEKAQKARPVVQRLLHDMEAAPLSRRPILLLAADSLARYIQPPNSAAPQDQDSGERREVLSGFTLTYQWERQGPGWVYLHDLLRQVWREYGASEWAERAFVLLLSERRWDTCQSEDLFKTVIEEGESFLARRPQSPQRVAVTFALAGAYETWWALSQAEDGYVSRDQYQKGSDLARQKAIQDYEQVVRLAPESQEAIYARRQLPRLKLGLDTGQRQFFCIYD